MCGETKDCMNVVDNVAQNDSRSCAMSQIHSLAQDRRRRQPTTKYSWHNALRVIEFLTIYSSYQKPSLNTTKTNLDPKT